jgi:folate-dependent phosphoribosylglycinamide formyltransferase PurN
MSDVTDSDKVAIAYWLSGPLCSAINPHCFSVICQKTRFLAERKEIWREMRVIWLDNIRVGCRLETEDKLSFLLAPSAAAFTLLSQNSVADNTRVWNSLGVEVSFIDDDSTLGEAPTLPEEILIAFSQKQTLRVLLCGPSKRNTEISRKLTLEGHSVSETNQKLRIHDNYKDFDYLISNGYPHKFQPWVVEAHPTSILNIHGALLPWGRGIGTTPFSFVLGYPLGVSIHLCDESWDTGMTLDKLRISAPLLTETCRQVHNTLITRSIELFFQFWTEARAAGFMRGTPQVAPRISTFRTRLQSEAVLGLFAEGYDCTVAQLLSLHPFVQSGQKFMEHLARKICES